MGLGAFSPVRPRGRSARAKRQGILPFGIWDLEIGRSREDVPTGQRIGTKFGIRGQGSGVREGREMAPMRANRARFCTLLAPFSRHFGPFPTRVVKAGGVSSLSGEFLVRQGGTGIVSVEFRQTQILFQAGTIVLHPLGHHSSVVSHRSRVHELYAMACLGVDG